MRLHILCGLTALSIPALSLISACAPVQENSDPTNGVNVTVTPDDPFVDTDNQPTDAEPGTPDTTPTENDIQTDQEPETSPLPDPNNSTDEPNAPEQDFSDRFNPHHFKGEVTASDEYQLFELGVGFPGDVWRITQTSLTGRFTVVIMDDEFNMIRRGQVQPGTSVEHAVRSSSETFYVGVTPAYGTAGGSYEMQAKVASIAGVPEPDQQVVYLNFEATSGLDVNFKQNLSHSAFDASMLGAAYAGETQTIKDIILEQMERDFAAYDVEFMTSDDGPPPSGTHSTVYFGGEGEGLLGLADNVDQYNAEPRQDAIVFVETFEIYSVMNLTTNQMAQMVANTASHELGHLLGLYHTQDASEVMDTSANAWELTENQSFQRAPLDDSVFPFGYEDTPTLLEQIVGLRPGGPLQFTKQAPTMKADHAAMREMFAIEAPHRCGNCAHHH